MKGFLRASAPQVRFPKVPEHLVVWKISGGRRGVCGGALSLPTPARIACGNVTANGCSVYPAGVAGRGLSFPDGSAIFLVLHKHVRAWPCSVLRAKTSFAPHAPSDNPYLKIGSELEFRGNDRNSLF